MLPKPDTACFVIADISGYTSYLAGVELDHAHDIIADLMDTVLKALRPPFRLAKFEGDAAFVYAVTDKVDGSVLQDGVEAAYFAFRRRLRDIKTATTCECNACSKMQTLDLKFVAHHGEFIKQKMGGRQELAGRDVILIHRLLKNSVTERFGDHAYALYSDGCIKAMGIDAALQGLTEHHETIDILGEVTCWVRDLADAWQKENERSRFEVARADAGMLLEFEVAAPRAIVWEHFTVPGHRPKWQAADEVREMAVAGRRGAGTTNHCMHGEHAIIEEILDWRPFDYVSMATTVSPGAPKVYLTYAFFDRDGGTHIEVRVGKPKPKDREFVEGLSAGFGQMFGGAVQNLKLMLKGQQTSEAVVEEPEIPVPADRFITEPVHLH